MGRHFEYIIIAQFFAGFIAKSQSVYFGGTFPTLDHSGDINNKFAYGLYYFGAFPLLNISKPDINKDANFLLLYTEQSLTYKLNNQFSFTGSYVYQRTNAVYDNYVNENRFYIQAKFKHTINKINITHRLRFDGRFIQNRITKDTPFTHRLRYQIGLNFPIKTRKNNLYFNMYEEAFFNTGTSSNPVYAENWAYAALGFNLNEKNKIETGLLYIRWNTEKTYWFNQYYLQLTWISHLNFTKNKN